MFTRIRNVAPEGTWTLLQDVLVSPCASIIYLQVLTALLSARISRSKPLILCEGGGRVGRTYLAMSSQNGNGSEDLQQVPPLGLKSSVGMTILEAE